LAAAHVINFEKYINIREQLVSKKGTDEITINSIIRIAEYISSIHKTAVHAFKHMTKILVVDDEIRFARILKSILSRTGKYEVKIETRGSNTINTAHEFKPDLILLDMIMPDTRDEAIQVGIAGATISGDPCCSL
jgi:PleD family two-component response regulator